MDNSIKSIFSENLKYHMALSGKNQSDIIRDLGIRRATVSSWCNSQRIPRMDALNKLAAYFGTTVSDLVEKKDNGNHSGLYCKGESEKKLISSFRQVDNKGQKKILGYTEDILNIYNNKKKK